MASELLQAKGKNDMGLFASKNKRIEKETEDPFTFTIPYVNNLVSKAYIFSITLNGILKIVWLTTAS